MIDLTPSKNLARLDAIVHARRRANQLQTTMLVYVAPPDAPEQSLTNTLGCNVWYVRKQGEPAPENAELFETVIPATIS